MTINDEKSFNPTIKPNTSFADMDDGGADHFAQTVIEIKKR